MFRDQVIVNRIKVGLSENPLRRVRELYNTSTPLPLNLYQIWYVSDMRRAEKIAHNRLADHRINPRREFFEIAPENHFPESECADYEITTIYLDVLIELIENDLSDFGIEYMTMNIQKLYAHYWENNKTLPL